MRSYILTCIAALSLLCSFGCSQAYDDSALWKDIDQMYKDLKELRAQTATMQEQLDALSAIVAQSGSITAISKGADGNYTLSYKDAQNVEHTITIITPENADSEPIIGMKEEGGVWYWTSTVAGKTSFILDTDGAKIAVEGRTPQIGVDNEGYWTVFGVRILDSKGKPVKSEGKAASVIVDVKVEGTLVTFTLADGVTVSAVINEAFNILLDIPVNCTVENTSAPVIINYTMVGATETTVLKVEKFEGINKPVIDSKAQTITVTFPSEFETGSMTLIYYDGVDNVIIKPLSFTAILGAPTGIRNAEDLRNFAISFNRGGNIDKYVLDGEVKLVSDIDMSGVDWSDLSIGGKVIPSTTSTNTAVNYTAESVVFERTFNGAGFTIKNIDWVFNVADGNISHGLFSLLGNEAVVKDLTLSGKITVKGNAPQGATVGAFAGYSEGTVTNCVNNVNIHFEGDCADNIAVNIGGIAGSLNNGSIIECVNNGALTCAALTNTKANTNGSMHQGGIAGFTAGKALIDKCVNNGGISSPTGRCGGLVGAMLAGTLSNSTNKGLVQDDVNGTQPSGSHGNKRLGGLAGGTTGDASIDKCVNEGNVFSQLGCRTGGFAGHNEGPITDCENKGIILSDMIVVGTANHGAGWACGYNKDVTGILNCTMGGKVGDYSVYKNNPGSAPAATYKNAVCHGNFDAVKNGLSDQNDTFYAYTTESTKELAAGLKYTKLIMSNIDSDVHILEIDLSNQKIVFEAAMANEQMPNPNGNDYGNNGPNLREVLSETCLRRTSEGRNILAGVNTGFFDSHFGFPRSFHIEYDEPIFINNPEVRAHLSSTHYPGFAFFKDRSFSFGKRDFKGFVKSGDKEVEYYSVNDTIVALGLTKPSPKDPNTKLIHKPEYDYMRQANVYTSRFKATPFPGLSNTVGSKALFIVGRSNSDFKVNCGYIDGTVTQVLDGREGQPIMVPFVNGRNEWVLQLTGAAAEKMASVKAGDPISIMAEAKFGGETKSMYMYMGAMVQFLKDGQKNYPWAGDRKPGTIVGSNSDNSKVYVITISGSKSTGSGMDYFELYTFLKMLGLNNAIRYDGGGSTSMWLKDGGLVHKSCDSKGDERSCMNYLHIRLLD